jgi:hypothetical protein
MTKEESKKTPKPKGWIGAREGAGARAAHKKVFDVVPPGKSVAPPNSRSVIVGHKPPVKDDQFVPGSGNSKPAEVASESASTSAAETPAHSSMAGNPFEKRPLMGGHKKLGLKLASTAGQEETVTTSTASLVSPHNSGKSSGKQATTAPELSSPAPKSGPSDEGANKDSSAGERVSPASGVSEEAHGAPKTAAVSGAPALSGSASEHLADLAVEQIVETETFDKIDNVDKTGGAGGASTGGQSGELQVLDQPISGETPEPTGMGSRAGESSVGAGTASGRPSTVDDLLADTSPPNIAPEPQQAVVSHHHRRGGALRAILIILLILILGAAALNFLLDAEIIKTSLDLPHTDLIR